LRIFTLIAALLLLNSVGLANIITVPLDYPTIQKAINASKAGDTVLVTPGTYAEHLNLKGRAITLRSDGDGDPMTYDIQPDITIIDGTQTGSVVYFFSGEGADTILDGFTIINGSGLYLSATNSYYGGGIYCINSSPTITNNIIKNNTLTVQFNNAYGAGVYCENASPIISGNIITENKIPNGGGGGGGVAFVQSSPMLSDNKIFLNSTAAKGGALYIDLSSPVVTFNIISGNYANSGGGIYFENSAPQIRNNSFDGNSAFLSGGGMSCYGANGTAQISDNVFSKNSAGGGGAINCEDRGAYFLNNIICNNSACGAAGVQCNSSVTGKGDVTIFANNLVYCNQTVHMGGGMSLSGSCLLVNNVFYGNSADNGGGLFCTQSTAKPKAVNCIFWNNTANISGPQLHIEESAVLDIEYCDVKGGQSQAGITTGGSLIWGAGMISSNPSFVDPATFDFHIRHDSSCKDTGTKASVSLPDLDFDNNPRNANGEVDIGCDEFYPHLYFTHIPPSLFHPGQRRLRSVLSQIHRRTAH